MKFLVLICLFLSPMLSWAADKTVFKILKVTDLGVIIKVDSPISAGQNVLVVRGDDDDYEVISNGKVTAVKNGQAYIKTDLDRLKKRAEKTDYVVLLGAPKVFTPKIEDRPKDNGFQSDPIENKLEPGYIWLQYQSFSNHLESSSDNQANSLKNVGSVPKTGFELEWFLDFLSSYGIAIGQNSGVIPVESYNHRSVPADYSQNYFKIMYRTMKHRGFRGQFFIEGRTEEFSTLNTDEYVVSTKIDASLLGANIFWEPGDLLLHDKRTRFQFTYIKLGYSMALSLKAQDGVVARGTAATGNIGELRYGMGATMFLPWMPWVKRYTLALDGFQRKTDLRFSGPTAGENGGPYTIPENGSYSENESGVVISLGVRFDDMIGAIFKPKE